MIPFEKKYYVLELKEVVLVGQILFLELVLSDILPAEWLINGDMWRSSTVCLLDLDCCHHFEVQIQCWKRIHFEF